MSNFVGSLHAVVMNEVTKKLPSNRLVDYRLKMFDILVKAVEGQAQKGQGTGS